MKAVSVQRQASRKGATEVELHDCRNPTAQANALVAAAAALAAGDLVVLPTDTVYGLAANARNPAAIGRLFATKGRGRSMPPPVLIGALAQLDTLVSQVSPAAAELAKAFWPGALTIVLPTNPELKWDLGDLAGTIAVRWPNHPLTCELLRQTGPLAVSSANLTGQRPALTAAQAVAQIGDNVAVVLDDGPVAGGAVSSLVDLTGPSPRLLRAGAIDLASLRTVLPDLSQGGSPST